MRLWLTRLAICAAFLLFTASFAVEAQQAGKVPRIGVLGGSLESGWIALREGLHELGYVEGQSIAIEWRGVRGDATRFSTIAEELVQLKVDVIVASNNPAIEAAQRATRTIPIVMVVALDAVHSGIVASLARPGGNITGVSAQHADVAGKGLQLLREAVPNLARLAILWDPAPTGMRRSVEATESAAKELGMRV